MKKRKPTLEEILQTNVCDCANVRQVIDSAVEMAWDWYDRAGTDLCPTHMTASLMVAIGIYGRIVVGGAGRNLGDDGVNMAARLLHDMRSLAQQADVDCHSYINEAINRIGSARHLDRLSTDGMTIQ